MDLRTTYMGMDLQNPLMVSASPLSGNIDTIRKMEEAGAAAVVMFSVFEEQIHNGAGTLSCFPRLEDYDVHPERYLDLLHQACTQVDIPVMGSLNGISCQSWIDYAGKMQDAGASAIELNAYYFPTDMDETAADVEQKYVDLIQAVKSSVTVPVALKLSPFFSSLANAARSFVEAGADALVLFNRFYQPDYDLETLEVKPTLHLSRPHEIRLPMMWIALLYRHLDVSLAATSGVHGVDEVIKYLLAGADVVMTASALLEKDVAHITTLVSDLTKWMEERDYESVEQMKGALSWESMADLSACLRANYIKVLENYKRM